MDFIEESPLNKAHILDRKADAFLAKFKFQDAGRCHGEAAANLLKASLLTTNKLALQSIELQRKYHLKKQELLTLKHKQQVSLEAASRIQNELMAHLQKLKEERATPQTERDDSLQKAIYRTFDEADSLLELLQHKGNKVIEVSQPSASAIGIKKPKDDTQVIEELRMVNTQLRNLITKLMSELQASEQEVLELKKQIASFSSCAPANIETLDTTSSDDLGELPPLDTPIFYHPNK